MTLTEKLKNIDKPPLPLVKTGSDETIEGFWNNFVLPLLPDKDVSISIYHMLLRYINEPDAVYAIRSFGSWSNRKHDNKELRRGFFNTTDSGYSFFYTDNFFAAYFCKMAIDGYVPDYAEFKQAMISREFPARFGPYDSKFEKEKAAYSIDGKKGRDPLFSKKGYKIAHIINTGENFWVNGENLKIKQICEMYYPRGNYNDWKLDRDSYGSLYVRHLGKMKPEAKEIIKAHFLRFICPLNYILTPGKNHHITVKKVLNKDIAESPELQQYAMEQFRIIYGSDYEDYLKHLMIAPISEIDNPGRYYIGINYGYGINYRNKANSAFVSKKAKKVGQYAKNVFSSLLKDVKLNDKQIKDLRNKSYCSKIMGISYPIIAQIGVDNYEYRRYYKEIVDGKYVICSQWYNKNKAKIDEWLISNGFL